MSLERMDDFFNSRVDVYEEHMLSNVAGANKFYVKTAEQLPNKTKLNILDLGCGTGLEINEIFKLHPHARISGVDLATDMLDKLQSKFQHKLSQLNPIEGDFFILDFGTNIFDAAISVQSMHHYHPIDKIKIYKKIYHSLKDEGVYIETDYTAPNQEFEDFNFSKYSKLKKKLKLHNGHYHFDTPCTVENQIKILKQAGFNSVDLVYKIAATVIIVAKK